MKNILYILILFSFIACENPIVEKVETKHPNGEKDRVSYFQEVEGKDVKVEEKHFHINGELKMSGKFLNGKREGEWKAYFDNKQLQSSGVYKDGLRTGLAKIYYPDGQLYIDGFYENGKQTGHWKFYNEAGKLVDEKDF
jgi:antitoxin component YwqK of YwqJK toxin-antitoxin module